MSDARLKIRALCRRYDRVVLDRAPAFCVRVEQSRVQQESQVCNLILNMVSFSKCILPYNYLIPILVEENEKKKKETVSAGW